MNEIWKPVEGVPFIEVSDAGKVRRQDQRSKLWREVAQTNTPRGYRFVAAPITGKPMFVHRLVCLAFHGPAPDGKPFVAHWDGDARNNSAANLRWVSAKQNAEDRMRHGRYAVGERHHAARLKAEDVRRMRARYGLGERCLALGNEFGVDAGTVERIVKRKIWRHVA
jgi:hypothetical protein